MKWFQIKEQSAGEKRLILTWKIYKIFGEKSLYFIASLVAFFTFVFNKNIRNFSKRYFEVAQKYTGLKPNLYNQFKHINSYANALADKILVYSGNFKPENLIFEDENIKKEMSSDVHKGKGVFFIHPHTGNVEVLQSFFRADNYPNFGINVFLSKAQSQIFNNFLNKIKIENPVKIFEVEQIGIETGIKLKENLDQGDIVFMAGDRISQNNSEKILKENLFGHKISLPKGIFKLAKFMEVPIYFISAIKEAGKYKIHLQKVEDIDNIVQNYVKFLEKNIFLAPHQFYHFYDFFE